MTQPELDFAVAMVTGECLSEIRRRGFSIADPVRRALRSRTVRRAAAVAGLGSSPGHDAALIRPAHRRRDFVAG